MNLEEFINKKYLDKGQFAKCYLLQNGTIFKQFNRPREIADIDRFKYFLEYANENFFFPFEFISDNKKFYGYIMKRALGKKLKDCFSSINLETLSDNSIQLQKNIDYVSNGKIVMLDLSSSNVMYDGNQFGVIDPDEYGIRYGATIDEVKEKNHDYYRNLITGLFLTSIVRNKNAQYILDRIKQYKSCDEKVSEIIIKIKEDMEKYYKETIGTVDDLNNIIRR